MKIYVKIFKATFRNAPPPFLTYIFIKNFKLLLILMDWNKYY